jgi:crotonobetainyl-CoA:carnitine CoA-transferase CaiB-like acyl-CoA transferase
MVINLREDDGRELFHDLVRGSDVLVENYRPGTLDAMGLGEASRTALNPRLIVTSLSGFGQTGPLADRALFDPIAQAMSGLMSLTGEVDGPPTLTGSYIADHVAALYGAIGTLVALRARDRTGLGQLVDVASFDALFSTLGLRPLAAEMLGETPARSGSRAPFSAPAGLFATRTAMSTSTAAPIALSAAVLGDRPSDSPPTSGSERRHARRDRRLDRVNPPGRPFAGPRWRRPCRRRCSFGRSRTSRTSSPPITSTPARCSRPSSIRRSGR